MLLLSMTIESGFPLALKILKVICTYLLCVFVCVYVCVCVCARMRVCDCKYGVHIWIKFRKIVFEICVSPKH